ncbi:MAG: hypothetical protein GX941_00760 [Candidatus Methanofastidiosa archaeon]|jgi:vacuolar-type H+-ATPase subunit E/Vma4|nr:hypothetical protein [Candidatus Methanofastidiosa archaeon]
MNVSTITKNIIEDAKKIARDYDNEVEEKKAIKLKEIDIAINNLKLKKQETLKEKISLLAKTEASKTNLEIKRKRLKMEYDVLGEIFLEAKNRLENIDQSQKEAILKKLLLSMDLEYIFSNKKDENYIREQIGKRYRGNVNAVGGILAEDATGKIKEDFTFETILRHVFENNLKEIRDISFSEVEYGFKCIHL